MKIIEEKIDIEFFNSKIFNEYFKDLSFCVFDIETTGLSPSKSAFILSGLMYKRESDLIFKQFFAESLEEEPLILAHTKDILESCDYVITYNGESFDIPFLQKRLQINGFSPLKSIYNLDIYKMVRFFSPIRKFTPNLKQKTLENYMGFWQDRGDEITGAESVQLYFDFLNIQDPNLMEKILLHNHDDVIQLYKLLAVLTRCDLHKAFFKGGFPVKALNNTFIIKSIRRKNTIMLVEGIQEQNPIELAYFGDNGLQFKFSKTHKNFNISLPTIERENLVFIDLLSMRLDTNQFEDNINFESGYLIIKKDDSICYREVNLLVQNIFERISSDGL